MRARGGKMHRGTTSSVGWPDAAYWGPSEGGRCRLGCIVGLTSSSLPVPCRVLQWTSKFTRRLVKRSLGGKVYAVREMAGGVKLLEEFYSHYLGISPGMGGMEDCES